ncbi:MAG: AraC family transcriptional regulator [Victivallaceae bacterium]|nr:AraC family transcriptional regulator [Victivallaceae bacterium]
MNFFDGINFVGFASITNHKNFVDKIFPNYFGIQFNSHGDLLFATHDQPLKQYNGSYVFITHPGVRFRYGSPPDSSGRAHCYICFSGERVKQYIKSGLLHIGGGEAIKLPDGEKFQLTLNELFNCLGSAHLNKAKAVNLLEALLLQIYKARIAPNESVPQQKILQVTEAIRRSSETNWNFERTAGEMNISLAHFRRIFKQLTGTAPQHYLNEIRLSKAAILLRETSEPIKLIADKTGFKDRFYFSRRFKKQFNIAPAAYRTEFGVKF